MPTTTNNSNDARLLILAPKGRDGELIGSTLHDSQLHIVLCRTIDEFCVKIEEGSAVGAMTEEALTEEGLARIVQFLGRQPPWSDFPFVVFASRADSSHSSTQRYERLKRLRNFTIFERPIYPVTLIIAIDSALRARQRQYLTRTHLEERSLAEEHMAEMNRDLEMRVAERTRELNKAQAAFYESQKMEAIGRLAGGVAHDFNNLITGIIGVTEEVRDSLNASSPQYDDLNEVIKAAQRASGLTRQLLAFGRKQVISQRVLDLNVLLSEIKRMLDPLLGEDIRVDYVLSPDLGRIRADRSHIEQVLMNLVLNSRDAMPKGGTITLRTTNLHTDVMRPVPADLSPGSYVCLSVQDTGTGIPAAIRDHVFEPFFTTKERGKGTGLGLATVYGIAKQNNGAVAVESVEGQGTTILIYLPQVMEALDNEMKTPKEDRALSGTETVLVVEDEDVVRRVAVKALRKAGYRVLEAPNGDEALRITEAYAEPIHLLVTDVVMPGLNGRDLTTRFLALRPDVPVLFMSGYTQDIILGRGILEPGTEFIEKSFTPETFSRKVREVLDSHKLTHTRT